MLLYKSLMFQFIHPDLPPDLKSAFQKSTLEWGSFTITRHPFSYWNRGELTINGTRTHLGLTGNELMAMLIGQQGEPVSPLMYAQQFRRDFKTFDTIFWARQMAKDIADMKRIIRSYPEASDCENKIAPVQTQIIREKGASDLVTATGYRLIP
ncbi:MAG: hypothetical protein DI551_05950 [Micavibrio aeruginosavorus]|uniref:Uncharacterized protein n=1 Tax=Micavibrio aeruginosavorus TaxID=349221 RepID=A0A2W5Q3T7_9BACT|nr:MAG: hypothetical protein DI551_05950 [Micavibrio aeruginosavorus]